MKSYDLIKKQEREKKARKSDSILIDNLLKSIHAMYAEGSAYLMDAMRWDNIYELMIIALPTALESLKKLRYTDYEEIFEEKCVIEDFGEIFFCYPNGPWDQDIVSLTYSEAVLFLEMLEDKRSIYKNLIRKVNPFANDLRRLMRKYKRHYFLKAYDNDVLEALDEIVGIVYAKHCQLMTMMRIWEKVEE